VKKINIQTLDELEKILSTYTNGYLFRGQTKHYLDENQEINIPTSFSRHGCIPPLMLKWTHYADSILNAFMGYPYQDISLELSQAILQHYGWRSFFIDLTKSPAVACWFAANQYSESFTMNMTENFEEEFIWMVHKQAQYTPSKSKGHIYIINVNILKSLEINIHDLTELKCEENALRFHAQQACLAGIPNNRLPEESIALHIEADNQVLRDYYEKKDIYKTEDIFPNRNKDFILNALLEIPWNLIPIDDSIHTYKRSLQLPEYDIEYFKFAPENVTLFNNFWIADNRQEDDHFLHNIPVYRLPEVSYFARNDEYFKFSEVNTLLETHPKIILELDGLIKLPRAGIDYEKGIYIEKNADTVSISALIIKHPGHIVTSIGVTLAWYYKIENGSWSKIENPEQCPCNNHFNHERHFSLLRVFNDFLNTHKFIQHNDLNYVHEEVKHV
jgi:hypothetical protein